MSVDGLRQGGKWSIASSETEWRLSNDQVHLWRACLDLPPERTRALERCLSPDERARAKRFVVNGVRNRFITARAVLRNLLSRYISEPPSNLRFRYAEHGKPDLSHPETSIRFNVSHSHDLAVYALTTNRSVGVDAEYLHRRSIMDRMKIARRLFSSSECAALEALPRGRRDHAFLACWTRKEAFIKAIGQGLSCPLDQFDVTVDPDDPAELLATRWDQTDAERWSMTSIDPGPDYIGALAVEGKDLRLTCWQWDHDRYE